MMVCVRNPTVHPNFDAYYDIAQTVQQKVQIRKDEKKRGKMKVPITIQNLGHRRLNDDSSNLLTSTDFSNSGTLYSLVRHGHKIRLIEISTVSIGILGIVGFSILNNYSFTGSKTISDNSNSSNVLPTIVTQDIATLRSPLISPTSAIPNTTNSDVNESADISAGSESSSNNDQNSFTNISINGRATTPSLQDQDNNTEYTSVIAQPNGNTAMEVTSTDNSNGSSDSFSSNDEDTSINSSSVSYDQEGQ